MRDHRKTIQLQLAQYRSIADAGGVQAIENIINQQGRPSQRRSFFVRVIAPGDETLFLSNPRLWQEFDFRRVDWQTEGEWQYFTSTRDATLLEVTSARLANNQLLQVGKRIQDREEILEEFPRHAFGDDDTDDPDWLGRRRVCGISGFAANPGSYSCHAFYRRDRTDGSPCA